MPLSPYDVLAPYNTLNRTQQLDRWTQLQTVPPAQQNLPLEPASSTAFDIASPCATPDITPAEDVPCAEPSPAIQPPSAPFREPPHSHRFYDQILKKHAAARQFASPMHRL